MNRTNYSKVHYSDYLELLKEKENLEKRIDDLKLVEYEYRLLQGRYETLAKNKEDLANENEALRKEVARLTAKLNINSSNSGIPTSKTAIGKEKLIPNTRIKSNKKKGGQPGHSKHKLEAFTEEEITDEIVIGYDKCPYCGGEVEEIEGADTVKCETDYKVTVRKVRYHFPNCKCKECQKEFRKEIPNNLKEENQYGSNLKAEIVALTNIGNVPANKIRRLISGASLGDINPSEGYIIKLQKKTAKDLEDFLVELKKKIIEKEIVYWDDTVIDVDTKRACLRFYGDEKAAYYVAHEHKDKEGLDEDQILNSLSKETKVMHDHNKVNYNSDYSFTNIECNIHLIRDLQKVTDETQHKWSQEVKQLIQEVIHERNQIISNGGSGFNEEYIESFFKRLDDNIFEGIVENKEDEKNYFSKDEKKLLRRILEYKINYFAWLSDFNLPVTNNESERSLRGSKTHMKVSGQFQSIQYAQYYAAIRSYIETCRRNGINEYEALVRLCSGRPFTVDEIFTSQSS